MYMGKMMKKKKMWESTLEKRYEFLTKYRP